MELYRKHRPKAFIDLFGQQKAVDSLKGFIQKKKIPHSLLFTGGSGTGKTTTARILKKHLACDDSAFYEINCADFRGIDMIREIRKQSKYKPVQGLTKVWLIDEAHQLSNPAQQAFLKLLEEPPSWVFFILATTEPNKLIKTIKTRCTEIHFKSLSVKETISYLETFIENNLDEEIPDEIIEEIADKSEGSHRKAIVMLDSYLNHSPKNRENFEIQTAEQRGQAIDLCRALFSGSSWLVVSGIIDKMEGDINNVQPIIYSYFNKILIGSNASKARKAFNIISTFMEYEEYKPLLAVSMSCYDLCMDRSEI